MGCGGFVPSCDIHGKIRLRDAKATAVAADNVKTTAANERRKR